MDPHNDYGILMNYRAETMRGAAQWAHNDRFVEELREQTQESKPRRFRIGLPCLPRWNVGPLSFRRMPFTRSCPESPAQA